MSNTIITEVLIKDALKSGEEYTVEPDGNNILIKTGNIPKSWKYKCYTYKKDDKWMLKSFCSEIVRNDEEIQMNAGQDPKDTFKLLIYDYHNMEIAELVVKAGDVIIINYDVCWEVLHGKKN